MLQMVHLAPTFPIGQAIQRTGKAAVSLSLTPPTLPGGENKQVDCQPLTHRTWSIKRGPGWSPETALCRVPEIMARLLILLCCISLPPLAFSRLHWNDCQLCLCPSSTAFCSALPLLQVKHRGGRNTNKVVSYSFLPGILHTLCMSVSSASNWAWDQEQVQCRLWVAALCMDGKCMQQLRLHWLQQSSFPICQMQNLFGISSFREDLTLLKMYRRWSIQFSSTSLSHTHTKKPKALDWQLKAKDIFQKKMRGSY